MPNERKEKFLEELLKEREGCNCSECRDARVLAQEVYDAAYSAAIEDALQKAEENDGDSAKPPYVIREEIIDAIRSLKENAAREGHVP